jgi:monothiol glutaredoxin
MEEIMERIRSEVTTHPVIIYMKGTPEAPQCGFSMRAVQALRECGAPFAHVDVLGSPDHRTNLPRFSHWPTFPQIFIQGELVGGCDIALDLHAKGELKKMVQEATAKAA